MVTNTLHSIYIKIKRRIDKKIFLAQSQAYQLKIKKIPKAPFNNTEYNACILLGYQSMGMAVAACKSLDITSDIAFHYIFIDDGTLRKKDLLYLKNNFPGCRVILTEDINQLMNGILDQYPLIKKSRSLQIHLRKLYDLAFIAPNQRIIVLDSDILFFKKPTFLLEQLLIHEGKTYFNKDIGNYYSYSIDVLYQTTGIKLQDKLNVGLMVINTNIINYDKIEKILEELLKYDSNLLSNGKQRYFLEQTLYALLAVDNKLGYDYLPEEYDINHTKHPKDGVCKHYCGDSRVKFENEGIEYLLRNYNIKDKWNAWITK